MTTQVERSTVTTSSPALTARLVVAAMLLCCVSYVINAMDRQVFPSLLVGIDKHYGFGLQQGGLLATIFTLGLGACGFFAGGFVQRFGRKRTMLVGIAIYSIFTILTGFALGFGDMFVYRALSGAGEALQNAALFTAVGAYFAANRAMAIGTLNFAYGTGSFFGPLFGTQIAAATGSWQLPFYVYGVLGLVFTVLIALIVPTAFTECEDREAVHATSGVKSVWNRNVALCVVAAAVVGVSMYGYIGLYPTYLRTELGYSVQTAGVMASMFGLGALVGIPAGWIGDRVSQRWVIIVSFLCAMVVGYSLFHGFPSPLAQGVLSFLQGAVASGFLFVNVYALIQRSAPPQAVATASGLYVTALYLPAALAGYLFASLSKAYGWGNAASIQLVAVVVVGIIAMLFYDERAARRSSS
ncbi:MAG TPA: MFS transporter [Candidatus Limnocylindria bacterium]|jgi:MFS family permease|nr:MFS transporter [Candidatus Limnocylindria bacterium]